MKRLLHFFNKEDRQYSKKQLTKNDIYTGSIKDDNDIVVLIPGLGRDSSSLKLLAEELTNQFGYCCYVMDHPNTKQSIEESANFIRQKIDLYDLERHTGKVHFVCASRGGLVTRKLLGRKKLKNQGRIVFLGTPHHGSELSNHFLSKNIIGFLAKLTSGPSIKQMQVGKKGIEKTFIPNELDQELDWGMIAGVVDENDKDHRESPLHPLESPIPYPHDGVVSLKSTKVKGLKDHVTLNGTSHIELEVDRDTIKLCNEFLKHGRFKTRPSENRSKDLIPRANRENPIYFKLIGLFYKPKV